jgi:hypothetical protein
LTPTIHRSGSWLGSDAIGNIEGRLERLTDELAAWRELGRATSLEDD